MSKEQLQRRVLADPKVEIYDCGRQDVPPARSTAASSRCSPTSPPRASASASPRCSAGTATYTTSGNVSNHSTGGAVDIAHLNGLPMLGNQGPGSVTETVLHEILDLQGAMMPDELISLMDLGGPSFAMSDHATTSTSATRSSTTAADRRSQGPGHRRS